METSSVAGNKNIGDGLKLALKFGVGTIRIVTPPQSYENGFLENFYFIHT
jgi:hypothetical protein